MRLFIEDQRKTVTVRIYGLDGHEITREYMQLFFRQARELHITTDDEKEKYDTDAELTLTSYDVFKVFAGYIGTIQDSIDSVADAIGEKHACEEFIFNNHYYAI